MQFATESGVPVSLLITSSQAGEGKSSTSLALSQNFAGSGKRVLLVDADLRKPTFRTQSGDVYGLSNLLTGDDLVEKAIHKTSVDNLFILPSGACESPAQSCQDWSVARGCASFSPG